MPSGTRHLQRSAERRQQRPPASDSLHSSEPVMSTELDNPSTALSTLSNQGMMHCCAVISQVRVHNDKEDPQTSGVPVAALSIKWFPKLLSNNRGCACCCWLCVWPWLCVRQRVMLHRPTLRGGLDLGRSPLAVLLCVCKGGALAVCTVSCQVGLHFFLFATVFKCCACDHESTHQDGEARVHAVPVKNQQETRRRQPHLSLKNTDYKKENIFLRNRQQDTFAVSKVLCVELRVFLRRLLEQRSEC